MIIRLQWEQVFGGQASKVNQAYARFCKRYHRQHRSNLNQSNQALANGFVFVHEIETGMAAAVTAATY